jgi:hypothetical protein
MLNHKKQGLIKAGVEISGIGASGPTKGFGAVVPMLVLQEVAAQHYLQLALPLVSGQDEVRHHSCYATAQAEAAAAAAVVLQRVWRTRCERLRYLKLRNAARDGTLVASAVFLQACWRGRLVRVAGALGSLRRAAAARAAAAEEQQKLEMQRAAAVMIQAVVRGHGVRRRLKAALEAARKLDFGPGCERGEAAGTGGRSVSLTEPWEADDGEDAWWHAPEKLLGGHVAAVAGGGGVEGTVPGKECRTGVWDLPRGVGQEQCCDTNKEDGTQHSMARSLAASSRQISAAAAASGAGASEEVSSTGFIERGGNDLPAVPSSAGVGSEEDMGAEQEESENGSPGRRSSPSRREAYEAKLKALMVEWGFRDMATAEMHYK